MYSAIIQELIERLQKGKVRFTFIKADGSLREAYGTKVLDFVPFNKHPQGAKKPSDDVITFFDLEKNEWKSLKRNTNVSILD